MLYPGGPVLNVPLHGILLNRSDLSVPSRYFYLDGL
jgi:hypothetical protein